MSSNIQKPLHKKVAVKVIEIVKLYNNYMRGINRLDHIIALYKSNIMSKKFVIDVIGLLYEII